MLFRSGKNWVVDFLQRPGWLLRRRTALRRRRSTVTVAVECLEDRTLLSTITVTTLTDEATANLQVSLREAIEAANSDLSVDGSVAGEAGVTNKIVFAAGLTGTISLDPTLGEMTISSSMIIQGLGASQTVIDAQQNSRIFQIDAGAGDVTLSDLTLENGKSSSSGGAIQSSSPGLLTISGSAITNSTVTGNHVAGGAIADFGGAVTIIDSTLTGNSTTGQLAQGGAVYTSTGDVTISGSTLSGNFTTNTSSPGGAVSTQHGQVTVTGSTLLGNSTGGKFSHGGAVYARFGAVTLTGSTLSGNSTTLDLARGGAVSSGDVVTVVSSTLSGNLTAGIGATGGAIHAYIAVSVTNSTLTDNSTSGTGADGGAVDSDHWNVTAVNSTIVKNHATNATGGGVFANISPGTVTLTNTILAQNTDGGTAPDFHGGGPLTVSYSLIGDNTGTGLAPLPVGSLDPSGNLIGTPGALIDPLLGPLADNGGPTQTMALLAGSPAINAGSSPLAVDPANGNAPLIYDQRGAPFLRIVGSSVDMGAYEVGPIVTSSTANLPANASSVTINGVGFDPTPANNSVIVKDTTTGISITVTPGTASTTSLTVPLAGIGTLTGGDALTAVVTSYGVDSFTPVQVATVAPVVTSSTANLAASATSVVISGFGFGLTKANDSVTLTDGFGHVISNTISTALATSLTLTLTGPLTGGTLYAVVTANGVSSGTAVQVATVTPVPAFVQSLYTDFLGRPGDAAGMVGWVDMANAGNFTGVADGIVRSTESLMRMVESLYQKILGRAGDAAGVASWVAFLQGGGTLEAATAGFYASAEYTLRFDLSNIEFVNRLYGDLLGRTADVPGLAGWVIALYGGTLTRAQVVVAFLNSVEYRTNFVVNLYADLLKRSAAPTAGEVAGWVNSGLDLISLQVAFAASLEYRMHV